MKKVYIITVFNSLNSGSFLQATSLYQAITGLGYDVAFIDTGARNLWKQASLQALYMIKQRNFIAAKERIRQAKVLKEELKKYKIVKLGDVKDIRDNIYVLGSDEIWNVARKDMAAFPIFWGKGLPLENSISYAPSLNTAQREHLSQYDFVKEALSGLQAISVRDHYSYEMLKKETDRDIAELCDPTFLIDPSRYENLKTPKDFNNYILVYLYAKRFDSKDKDELIRFARENNKKLVAFSSNFKWCDINVNGSPWDFLAYIKGADYVCTSTFHGTLFSALFGKQFAVFGNKNTKVTELLSALGLQDRKADAANLWEVFGTEYDHDRLNDTISKMRDKGIRYLEENIRIIQERCNVK